MANANLEVKVSTSGSCEDNVFFDVTYSNAIQDGIFNVLLGANNTLPLDFNRDYYMCLYVDGDLISGPTRFRGGQGEVNRMGDANSGSEIIFDHGHIIVRLEA